MTDNYPEPRGIASFLAKGLQINKYLESGSIGLKCALVGDGSADIFVRTLLFATGIGSAAVLLKEVGADLLDCFGNEYLFTGPTKSRMEL